MNDDVEAAARVRTLLLSGDNILKNRSSATRIKAARARYTEARSVAEAAGLSELLIFIDRRIEDVAADGS
jgi:hypothetical protein